MAAPPPPGADPAELTAWFDLETELALPQPILGYDDAEAAGAEYRKAARSDNTRLAYRSGVRRFADWCHANQRPALPASPATVAAFLAAEARAGLAVNTLRLRAAAIRALHLLAGHEPPTSTALVTTTVAGIQRSHRRPVDKKRALQADALRDVIAPIGEDLPGRRDKALLLVGFAAALRAGEIAMLEMTALTYHEDGIALVLPWRKNDQHGHGTTLWLPRGRTTLCPVLALEAWLEAAGITEGPLFRRVRRLPPPRVAKGAPPAAAAPRYLVGAQPIDTDSIALIVKKWTGRAGPDPALYAGHSLRRGAISTGVAEGVHIARLKQFSGHASLSSLEEYVELDELREHHPLKDAL